MRFEIMRCLLLMILAVTVAFTPSHRRKLLFNRDGGTPHNHPATPLLYEDFENATGYDLAGWGEDFAVGRVDEDYTGVVLRGTQSLIITNDPADGIVYTTNSFAANGRVWVSFLFRVNAGPSTEATICELQDAGGACQSRVVLNGDLELLVQVVCGGTSTPLPFPIAANTTYYLWWEYDQDNGVNSYANLAVSTSGVRPTSGDFYVEMTGTSVATEVSKILLGQNNTPPNPSLEVIYDHVLVDDEQIPDYP